MKIGSALKVVVCAGIIATTCLPLPALADTFNGKYWKHTENPKWGLVNGYTCPSGQVVGYTYRSWRVGAVISGYWISQESALFVGCFKEVPRPAAKSNPNPTKTR